MAQRKSWREKPANAGCSVKRGEMIAFVTIENRYLWQVIYLVKQLRLPDFQSVSGGRVLIRVSLPQSFQLRATA
jgi:hypothetical protein